MKTFFVGLWVLLVSLGSSFAVATLGSGAGGAQGAAEKPALTLEKTRVLNIPIIADGAVRGFIVAQFNYTVDAAKTKNTPVSPEVFILDEAFRTIYTDDHLDFLHLEKYDVGALTTHLVEVANKRLGANVVHDVLIHDFTFISKEENDR